MSLVLSEEQSLLKQTAAEFISEHSPISHLREMRDTANSVGFSRDLWKQMAELGWTGILLPEEYGGSDLGMAELGVLLEECGRTLAPYPFLSTAVMGATAIALGGTEMQKSEILTGISSGEQIVAVAFQESPRFDPYSISTSAQTSGDRFILSGRKIWVWDACPANQLIVAARTSGQSGDRNGISLFLVDPSRQGVEITKTQMVDSRNSAQLRFDDLLLSSDALIGEINEGAGILDAVYERCTAALAAELFGISQEIFERTLAYLKTREQFGSLIGTFQALKHRAADLFCEVELTHSIVLDALRAIDEDRPYRERLVSAAKARASDTASRVCREGLQMHGGIGMTDEVDIGLFMKRAKAAEIALGDSSFHRNRFAEATGF
ncbi:acyl-CoA dehydrogenase [Myxococcota bacterium]|nr:acyl-CoA dehydrogenase [Myxococcota bacterium]